MKFWDTSALMPLIVEEATSTAMVALADEDAEIVIWTLTSVEITAAIWRRNRAAPDEAAHGRATAQAAILASRWREVDEVEPVARIARQLVSVHALKAADSLQLAAAVWMAGGKPATLPFVTLDTRLAEAARAEGFPVLP